MVTKVATRFIGATDRDTAQERLLTLGTSAPLLYQCFQTDRRKTPISEVPVFYTFTWASLLWTLLTYCSACNLILVPTDAWNAKSKFSIHRSYICEGSHCEVHM